MQQVQRSGRSDRAFRPGEGILDGKAHIRRAQLCQHRIITVFHQGVNYTLPVDHNGNFLGRHPVESHSFDELKPFIHQGGGVHGDLGSHGPVGMLQRLGQRHLPELLPAPSIEGSSGSGEDETAHFPSVSAALKALENSRMFRIHRHDLRPAAIRLVHNELPGAHHSFFIGQCDSLSPPDGAQSGLQPGHAHHGGEYGIGGFQGRSLQQSLLA